MTNIYRFKIGRLKWAQTRLLKKIKKHLKTNGPLVVNASCYGFPPVHCVCRTKHPLMLQIKTQLHFVKTPVTSGKSSPIKPWSIICPHPVISKTLLKHKVLMIFNTKGHIHMKKRWTAWIEQHPPQKLKPCALYSTLTCQFKPSTCCDMHMTRYKYSMDECKTIGCNTKASTTASHLKLSFSKIIHQELLKGWACLIYT